MDGNKIRKIREQKGISLNKLNEMTGISKSYISLLERGIQTNPSINVLDKLSEALGVNMETLIDKRVIVEEHQEKILKVQVELSEKDLESDKHEKVKELLEILGNPH